MAQFTTQELPSVNVHEYHYHLKMLKLLPTKGLLFLSLLIVVHVNVT